MSAETAARPLVLASASPRRRELLQQLGIEFTCLPAEIDETPRPGEQAIAYVRRMAQEKADAVLERYLPGECVVLAADTTVVIDDLVLGKPQDLQDGMAILQRLSGRGHTVFTAVCIGDGVQQRSEVVATEVNFIKLSAHTCAAYLATDEPWDKAGAYAIQGLGGALVESIRGSYSNVVGLPLCETRQMLGEFAVRTVLEGAGE